MKCKNCKFYKFDRCTNNNFCYNGSLFTDKGALLDMDGNELYIGDIVFIATNAKEIVRAEIVEVTHFNVLKLRTLKNRFSMKRDRDVLLDKGSIITKKGIKNV